jgi:hypothetical protein
VDLCATEGIPQDFAFAKPCFDISSDHSLITLIADALNQGKTPTLSNGHTNRYSFRSLVNDINFKFPLKHGEGTEATAKFFNDTILYAGWNATPEHKDTQGISLPNNN